MAFSIGVEFDHAIDWSKRLDQEIPFLRAWLKSWNARLVVDMACGSGRHCVALAAQGFRMTGVDSDLLMLAAASRHALVQGLSVDPEAAAGSAVFLSGDLRRTPTLERQDAVLCLGNSLCLLADRDEVLQALRSFHALLPTKGGIILHLLNYTRFQDPAHAFFPLKTDLENGRPRRHYLKMIEHKGGEAIVHLVLIEEEAGQWSRRVKSDRLLILEATDLQELVLRAGFGEVQIYGSLKGELFHQESHDVVLCARARC